ncbi:MAG: S49 family peptidase [Persephonella sp.]|nr:S49 family peptidase [Persephonella sp.]
MGNVAASGGYYISVPANVIYANPGTITGSIGVIIQHVSFAKVLEKLGIKK